MDEESQPEKKKRTDSISSARLEGDVSKSKSIDVGIQTIDETIDEPESNQPLVNQVSESTNSVLDDQGHVSLPRF